MPKWVLNPKSLKPEPLNDDDRKILLRGEAFKALVGTVAWTEILDFLEMLDDEALAAMRGNQSSDPRVALHLQNKWQERRYVLNQLQHHVLGSIEYRETLLTQENENHKLMEEIYGVRS